MEFRQLQYTLQIAAEKNFSRAAEKLHIAQPSLSQQLSKLEKEIGVMLFRRSTNSVELTYAGTLFVEKAQKIVDMVGQLQNEMDDIAQMKRGRLVIGSLPITGSHILPLVLPVFRSKYPEIEMVLVEETTANLEAFAASGQTDICLLSLPIVDQALTWQHLIEEPICLAVPRRHALAQKDGENESGVPAPAQLGQLREEPFIVLKQGQGFRQIAFDLCRAAGFEPNIVFESSNIETVQSLVAAGMGIAFVPSMVTRAQWSELAPAYVPLEGNPTRTLVIAHRKGRYLSKAADAFISTMQEVLRPGGAASSASMVKS